MKKVTGLSTVCEVLNKKLTSKECLAVTQILLKVVAALLSFRLEKKEVLVS